MALTWAELESVTNDYFMMDGKAPVDIYFNTSWLLNRLMKQQGGIWERPNGGEKIRIPLEYDGQEADFYSKGATLSSDDRESVNAAYFDWKHCYGNATIYRIDTLKNAGEYAEVQLVTQRVAGAQKSLTKLLAGSIYDEPGGSSERLTGIMACCHETAATAYGNIAENDLVAQDGTKPWEGKRVATATALTLNLIRTLATATKIRDGKGGKADLVVTDETNWNTVADILQVQQRFTNDTPAAKAGFTALKFEGKEVVADDFLPASYMIGLNTNHIGFAIHQNGYFVRSKWKVIPDSAEDKTMKLYWDGNLVVNNRKGHKAYTDVS